MRFLFDENCPIHLANGIKHLEQGNHKSKHQSEVLYILDFVGKGSSPEDEEVIKIAGKQKAIIVTQDEDFKRIKHYRQSYIEHNVGVIFYKSPSGGMTYWEVVKSFIKTWEEMKKELSKLQPPFVCEIHKQGHSFRTDLIKKQ
jgi:predicted nuclease of predicted toxin-antitoxin system